jgi:riboflavin biosynthesis pyrimidine reductase
VRRLLPTRDGSGTSLFPTDRSTDDIDVATAVAAAPRSPPQDRPWVLANMIISVDGAVVGADGRSGSLSGPADRLVFRALRGVADVILAGAATVRAEKYGPPRLAPDVQHVRRQRGQSALPRMAVVSAGLRLDPTQGLFREAPADQRPIVLTTTEALRARPGTQPDDPLADLADVAELRECGQHTVDWTRALRQLRRDAGVVLVEGGPTVNSQLIVADLIDEYCLTVSPSLVGRAGLAWATGDAADSLRRLHLRDVLEQDDFLFLRYLRDGVTTVTE